MTTERKRQECDGCGRTPPVLIRRLWPAGMEAGDWFNNVEGEYEKKGDQVKLCLRCVVAIGRQ